LFSIFVLLKSKPRCRNNPLKSFKQKRMSSLFKVVGSVLALAIVCLVAAAYATGDERLMAFVQLHWLQLLVAFSAIGVQALVTICSEGNSAPVDKNFSAEFLATKAAVSGVHKLPSGMLFEVIACSGGGSGKKSPNATDPCEVHYCGTLASGKKFDSSYDRGEPLTFRPNQVISGWTEALQLMREGDKWRVYIPQNLAYGASGAPPVIPPYAPLVFEMELLKVKGPGKSAEAAGERLKALIGKTHDEL
jgi:FKBP-type peptidyl-prolyl cis-trans isomerase FklB